jgi:hypothetical protein
VAPKQLLQLLQLLKSAFKKNAQLYVVLHNVYVEEVKTEKNSRLLPHDLSVQDKEHEYQDGKAVERAIPKERPPSQLEVGHHECAHSNNKEYIEDC